MIKMTRWCSLALAALMLAGCSTRVAGTVTPARDSAGIIGIGRTIAEVLPTAAELSRALGAQIGESEFPPSVGGSDVLSGFAPPGVDMACAAVVHPTLRGPFRGSTARAAAVHRWSTLESHDFSITASAVALGSPHDARELFGQFARQWQGCDGTVEIDRHGADEVDIPDYSNRITHVQTVDGTLTAVVILTDSGNATPLPFQRAVAIAYNCMLDVELVDFRALHSEPASADQALKVVELMVHKAAG